MWLAKFKAAAKHGLATLLIAVLASILVFYIWYPGLYSEIMPGTKLFLLVLGVEVVLGPCMSLVIYNPIKSRAELYRDYAVVIAIQFAALAYGIFNVAQSRPAFVVFVKDRLEVVAAAEVDMGKGDNTEQDPSFSISLTGPVTVCARAPSTREEREHILFTIVPTGRDVQHLASFYEACQPGQIYAAAHPLLTLKERVASRNRTDILSQLDQYSIEKEQPNWLPITSRFGAWTALVNKKNQIISLISFDPY